MTVADAALHLQELGYRPILLEDGRVEWEWNLPGDSPGGREGAEVARFMEMVQGNRGAVRRALGLPADGPARPDVEEARKRAQARKSAQAPDDAKSSDQKAESERKQATDGAQVAQPKGPPQAQVLVELAADAELFHTAEGECYATIPVGDHLETWPLRVKGFRRWLQQRFFDREGKPPGSQALQDALGVLEGRALFDGPEVPVYVRLAEHEGRVYLDLGDPSWRAVEEGPDGWRVVSSDHVPVRFRRGRGIKPLPEPKPGGTLADLRPFLNAENAEDDSAWVLMVAWLVAAARPRGPYPILTLQGEQGAAKSSVARFLRSLVDPSTVMLRTLPREERDLAIMASNAWCIVLDNVSGLPTWLSDALCRVATGGGFGTRELYSDAEEALFDYTRPVVVNGIEEIATRHDLLDRALVVNLPPIPEEQRRPEKELAAAFEAVVPSVLGALLDAAVAGLRNLPHTRLERLPRMADFALWVAACEEALPWEGGTFLRVYRENRAEAVEAALEADLVAVAVRALLARGGSWTGTATELLKRLAEFIPEGQQRTKSWPKTAKGLSGRLRRAATFLRGVGVEVILGSRGTGHAKRRVVTLKRKGEEEKEGNDASQPSHASQGGENPHGDGVSPGTHHGTHEQAGTHRASHGTHEGRIDEASEPASGGTWDARDAQVPTPPSASGGGEGAWID